MSGYKSETGEFKGSKTFSVLNGDKRVVTIGVTKAKALLAVYEELKTFVNENDKGTKSVDLSNLTEEQKTLISQFIKT